MSSNSTPTKVVWWIMGIISAFLMIGFSAWLTSVQAGITTAQSDIKTQGVKIASLQEIASGTVNRLDRIENKIDRLSDRS